MRKPIVGLIGAIGAGKSTVAAILARLGGAVVDADAAGHDVLEQPAVREKVAARWENVLKADGRVDRRKVAEIVFANPVERKALEGIVFPYIRHKCEAAIASAQADAGTKFVVLDAAVMIEAGWTDVCDKLVYVDAPRETRLTRVAARSGWADADLTAREAAQLPAADKKKHAHVILENSGSREELTATVERILHEWKISA